MATLLGQRGNVHNSAVRAKLNSIPISPGIYQFFDSEGTILYIGKAVNLRSRVKSYFAADLIDRPWVRQMIPLISDVSTIQAENEVEALILESNLIKKHKPKYNLSLKDDKRYAWILVDTRSSFPKVSKTRDTGAKGRLFGPYPDGRAVNQVLSYLRQLYPYRDCNLDMFPDRDRSHFKRQRRCVYHHLGLCTAPCDNLVSPQEYKKNIKDIIKTLQGKKKSHIRRLEKKMEHYAASQNFEKAALLRDKVRDLRYLSQRIDIQYGDAEEEFKKIQQSRFLAGVREACKVLDIPMPEHKLKSVRIECYDISNLAGEVTYGSMTVTQGFSIITSDYRIFKIREDKKINDPEMLGKVLTRRLAYLSRNINDETPRSESLMKRPTIILLDGAHPQLSAARPLVPESVGLMAISKGKHLKRAGEAKTDEFWTYGRDGKIHKLPLQNPFLFQHLRDEAHRFAIKYHRKGKRFLQKKSVLDEIEGIGAKRKKALIRRFKTISAIASASETELTEVIKNKTLAQAVKTFLNDRRYSQGRIRKRPNRLRKM